MWNGSTLTDRAFNCLNNLPLRPSLSLFYPFQMVYQRNNNALLCEQGHSPNGYTKPIHIHKASSFFPFFFLLPPRTLVLREREREGPWATSFPAASSRAHERSLHGRLDKLFQPIDVENTECVCVDHFFFVRGWKMFSLERQKRNAVS